MAIGIGSNIVALRALGRMRTASDELASASLRLSSGLRINRASDDAAGLAVSSSLQLRQRVLARGVTNANDAISMLQIAGGSLQQLQSIVERLKELAQQASTGTLSNSQRSSLNTEAQALRKEYNRITESTQFNGIKIHGANQSNTQFQLGFGSDGIIAGLFGDGLERNVGNGSFSAGKVTPGISAARELKTGDFNGDGILDSVYITSPSSTINVRFGNGDGTFGAAAGYSMAANASALEVGDFDNDGKDDIVVGDISGRVQVATYNGSWSLKTVSASNSEGNSVDYLSVGDFNADGNLDVASISATFISGSTHIHVGSGNGTFYNRVDLGGAFISVGGGQVTVGDYNGDGRLDVAASSGGTASAYIFLNRGNTNGLPTFSASQLSGAGGAGSYDLRSGDLDGDGRDELYANTGTQLNRYRYESGTNLTANGSISISGLLEFELVDLNADGYLDVAGLNASSYRTLLNDGDGTFGALNTTSLTGETKNQFTTGDFNDDGILDIISIGASEIRSDFGVPTGATTMDLFDISTKEGALEALELFETSAQRVSGETGLIGAILSRLEVGLRNLETSRDGHQAAASRIVDADVAAETARYVQKDLLLRSASAVLAQANQIPALALTLLGANTTPQGKASSEKPKE